MVIVVYTQSFKNCKKTKVIAPTSSSEILTLLVTDNPGESNMLINAIKDITENPSKVKSNFDQTPVDEDDHLFMRVLERAYN